MLVDNDSGAGVVPSGRQVDDNTHDDAMKISIGSPTTNSNSSSNTNLPATHKEGELEHHDESDQDPTGTDSSSPLRVGVLGRSNARSSLPRVPPTSLARGSDVQSQPGAFAYEGMSAAPEPMIDPEEQQPDTLGAVNDAGVDMGGMVTARPVGNEELAEHIVPANAVDPEEAERRAAITRKQLRQKAGMMLAVAIFW